MSNKFNVPLYVWISEKQYQAVNELVTLSTHSGVAMKKNTVIRAALDYGLAFLLEGTKYVEGVSDEDVN